jgi:hypothetical protein
MAAMDKMRNRPLETHAAGAPEGAPERAPGDELNRPASAGRRYRAVREQAAGQARMRPPWPARPVWGDVAALALLALATLGFFWRVATGQNWMPADGGDLVSFLYPAYRFAAATLHSGAWPLWNPTLYVGAPHVADIQAGFLYPPNLLLFLLLPNFPYAALQWLSMGHIWFAGAGMYLLLRRGHHLRRSAALAGALAFMFSDGFLIHFGNLNFIAVAAWAPWVFWAFRPQRLSRAALAGVLLAVGTLAGHIQATLFILLALAIYTALWLWLRRDEANPGRTVLMAVGALAMTTAVTSLLAAPVLLPGFELAQYTDRATWNYQAAAGYSLAPAQWIGLLVPNFFGRGPQYHWGAWPRVEAGYLGILPLFLAALAIGLRRDRQTWAWFGLAAVTFVLALGTYAIPHGWLTLVPGFGQLRAPARLVLMTDFGLAALAAIGLDAALGPLTEYARAAVNRVFRGAGYATGITLGIIAPLAYLGLVFVQNQDPAVVSRVSIIVISLMLFAGLLGASLFWLAALRGGWGRADTLAWAAAVLILLDLASTGAYQDVGNEDPSQGFQHPALANFLAGQPGPFRIDTRTDINQIWEPDTATFYGLEDVGGIDNPLLLADVHRYWEGLGSRSSRLYDLLGVRYVIGRKDVTLDFKKFTPVFEGDPALNVYENRQALPRAMFVTQVQPAADHEAAWAAIHQDGFEPTASAVVENAPTQPLTGPGQITRVSTAPNQLSVDVTAGAPALLLVSQVWYPGWQVRIDGVSQGQPLRTDYLFQGVVVPAGTHHIELTFSPSSWRVGWVLAALAAVGLVACAILQRRAVRRTAYRRAPQQGAASQS